MAEATRESDGRMLTWAAFAAAAPHLESFGRRRLERRIAYLATIRANGSPRVHPVSPFFGGGSLYLYMEPASPKVADLRRDPRYALHCGVEDNSGGDGEFHITGRAEKITDQRRRTEAFEGARVAGYEPADRHVVFELKAGQVLSTTYGKSRKSERWSSAGR